MILREAQSIMVAILDEIDRICRENDIEYYISDGTLLGAVRHGGFIPWDDDLDVSMTRENYIKFCKVANDEIGEDFLVQTSKSDKHFHNGCVMKVRHKHSLLKELARENVKFHQGIFVDVFPMDKLPSNKRLIKFQKKLATLFFFIKNDYDTNSKLKKCFLGAFSPVRHSFLQKILCSTLRFNKKCETDKYTYGVDTYFYNEFIYDENDLFPLKEIKFEGRTVMCPNKPHKVLTKLYGDYMKLPPVEERHIHSSRIEIYKGVEDERKIAL
ncbi:MAG: LicD family protein [Sarcina sp.]